MALTSITGIRFTPSLDNQDTWTTILRVEMDADLISGQYIPKANVECESIVNPQKEALTDLFIIEKQFKK